MRRIPLLLGACALAGLGVLAFRVKPLVAARVGAGFASLVTCSLVFDSGLDPEWVMRDYESHVLGPASVLLRVHVDRDAGAVVGRGAGLAEARSIYRPGLGCTLLAGADEAALRRFQDPPHAAPLPADRPWPLGEGPIAVPAPAAVEAAVTEAFREPEARPGRMRQTLAVLVAQHGRLVAERYAPGVTAATPLLSWSMAKSVNAALVGAAVQEGGLDLRAAAPVPEWRAPGDPRGAITLDELLRMSSGLAFDEHYGAVNDVSRMLFTQQDVGAFAARFPLAHPPDRFWAYSSGSSNIVARALRDHLGGSLEDRVRWSRAALFDPIGMRTAIAQVDASGSIIGSSLVFASGRDWARFGQLHLQDGVWEGARILPEGWVRYVSAPTPAAPEGRYGAGFWLNAGDPREPARRMWPSLPRDVYAARGMSGQYVVIVPSAGLVVVRLGLSQAEGDALHGIEPLVRDVLAALGGA